jgi:restriction endonuclease S subunit
MRTGVAQPHLDKARVLDIEIPLPPLDVQTRIAAELDALEETKRGLLNAADLARRAMRSTLDARLGAEPPVATTDSDFSDMDTASI